jgi:hypothetical protein
MVRRVATALGGTGGYHLNEKAPPNRRSGGAMETGIY